MDLHTAHYQVCKSERSQYLKRLDEMTSIKKITYQKNTPRTINSYLTVINDITISTSLSELSSHFKHHQGMKLVEKYKETGKADSGRGNIYFDKGFSCAQNQERDKLHYGLAGPRLRSVCNHMESEDKIFCDKSESLLMKAMKEQLPKACMGKESKLYLVPPSNQTYIKNKCAAFHATRYAITDEKHVLNVHVDSQNPR